MGTAAVMKSAAKLNDDARRQALANQYQKEIPFPHPHGLVYNSLCSWSLDLTDTKDKDQDKDKDKESKMNIVSPSTIDMGKDMNGKAITMPYPTRTASASSIESALHCHFRTTWDRPKTVQPSYYDANSVPSMNHISFLFGEIRPSGVRTIFDRPQMKTREGSKHFIDLGAGHGRLAMQVYLDYPNVSVTAVELHDGRFWNAYHAVFRLWQQNQKLFEIISYDATSKGKRSICIRSLIYGNTLTMCEGDMFDEKYQVLTRTADYVFAEIAFPCYFECECADKKQCRALPGRRALLVLLLRLKAKASILLYERIRRHLFILPEESKMVAVISDTAIDIDIGEAPSTSTSTKTSKRLFGSLSPDGENPVVSVTWGEYDFEQLVRTDDDASSVIEALVSHL